MAKKLNKHRILLTQLTVAICTLVVIFSKPTISDNHLIHEIVEFIGYFLVAICALGRVWVTAFIGGFKNQRVIDYGPFSVVRNPLYLLSLVGILGLSLISVNLIVACVMMAFFGILYHLLIGREEALLLTEFGDSFRKYKKGTPRLVPNFLLYWVPEELTVRPRFVTLALFDSIWWFVPLPVFELIEELQQSGVIKVVKLL